MKNSLECRDQSTGAQVAERQNWWCRDSLGRRAIGGGELGRRARLLWELQGTMGGGEYEVVCWPTPLPCFYRPEMAAEGSLPPIFFSFAIFSEFLALLAFCILKKNCKLIIMTNKNYAKLYYMTHK